MVQLREKRRARNPRHKKKSVNRMQGRPTTICILQQYDMCSVSGADIAPATSQNC